MKLSRLYDRRIKIVGTTGPATGSPGAVEKLIKAGILKWRFRDSEARASETW